MFFTELYSTSRVLFGEAGFVTSTEVEARSEASAGNGRTEMKYLRAVMLGATLMTGAATWVAAQAIVPMQGWQYHNDDDDRQAFREGYRQGKWDARNGRRPDARTYRWREEDDRRAYANGYIRGYREVNAEWRERGDGDGDEDDGYGRGGWGWGRDRGNYANSARQYGMQDGFNDGQRDRQTGHSYRPTHDDNYKHADRGYDYRFGNKNDYKQAYRDAYSQGYQQGYNGGVWQRR